MKRIILVAVFVFTAFTYAGAAEIGGILKATYEKPGVAESFKVGADWYPYPAYSDRDAWDKLFTKESRKAAIKKGEKYLKYKWSHIPASTFIALKTTGDKQELRKIENKNREAFCALMIAELAEGKGRFIEDIADGIWFYGTSYHWSLSNQTYGKLPRFEQEKIALGNVKIAVTVCVGWHFFHEELDKIDRAISAVFQETVKRIIIDPALEGYGTDKFRWLGPTNTKRNNWNPWCNHGALLPILLMEKDQDRLNAAVRASVENVDEYLKWYTPDAACEEGAGYWGQSVGRFCEYLQMLYDASGGKFDVLPNEFITNMATYRSRAYIGVDARINRTIMMNFADGNSSHNTEPSLMLWKVGKLFRNRELCDLCLYTCANVSKKRFEYPKVSDVEGYRLLENVRCIGEISAEIDKLNSSLEEGADFETVRNRLRREVPHSTWYPFTQQAMLRTTDGWFLGAKAGNNGETHGHNDVGSFILCYDNIRFFVDPGVGTYTAQTFSKNRFKLWTMVSEWHNCPAPNGVNQMNGKEFAASSSVFSENKKSRIMTSEISGAYPPEAACTSYIRKLTLNDSATSSKLVLEDTYALKERIAADEVHFITPGKVRLVKDGVVEVECENVTMVLTYPATLKASVENHDIVESNLQRQWGDTLKKISLTSSKTAPLTGSYKFTFYIKQLL